MRSLIRHVLTSRVFTQPIQAAGPLLARRPLQWRAWLAATVLGCLSPLIAPPLARAADSGPVTDPLGVIRIPKGAPIQIGGYWVISGPDTALGTD